MKRLFIPLILSVAAIACTPKDNNLRLTEQAAAEYLEPVHPGSSERPFWNGFAKKFIYAPSFDFKRVDGAANYLYTATAEDGTSWNFTA